VSPDAAGSAGRTTPARIAALGALLAAVVLVLILFLGSGNGSSYRLLFETGGQLVPGNQVSVGGHPIGSVEEITLTDDWQADVKISVDEPLHQGTTAVIRTTSLSGIANRYISITRGPDNAPALDDGDVITAERTTSPVDIDQLFDTFTPRARKGLRDVIQGFAASYTGAGEAANKTYKYLPPALQSTQRVLAELTRDQQVFSDFLVDGSRVREGDHVDVLATFGGGRPYTETVAPGLEVLSVIDAEGTEIVAAIAAAAAGLVALRPDVIAPLLPTRSRTRGGEGAPIQPLTRREVEVLGMLADGLGNKLIAARLGISEHTVKFHVAAIFGKLDVGSRTEAVRRGIRRGLIPI